jgi:hypothetical protein
MPDVSIKLETAGAVKDATFNPARGANVVLAFDPLKASVGIDYSQSDSLAIKVAGELSLESLGLAGIDLGLEGDASVAGKGAVKGTLTWTIDKAVSAKATVAYGTAGPSAMAALTIAFG